MNINPYHFILATIFSIQSLVGWGQVQFAELGDYTLENVQTLRDCKLGYRTFSQLNADRSNAILFPTWYGGTSENLLSYIGPDQMLDSTQYFVIIVCTGQRSFFITL